MPRLLPNVSAPFCCLSLIISRGLGNSTLSLGRSEPHLTDTCIWGPREYLAGTRFHQAFLVQSYILLGIRVNFAPNSKRKNELRNQSCHAPLVFLSHKPKRVQEGRYQFRTLSTLFPPYPATSLRKTVLSCHNSWGFSSAPRPYLGSDPSLPLSQPISLLLHLLLPFPSSFLLLAGWA